MISRRGAIVLAAVVVLGAPGCGLRRPRTEETVELRMDSADELEAAVVAATEDGDPSVPLSDYVQESFDEVLAFPEFTAAATINEAAGVELVHDDVFTSATQLFLFRRDGRGVHAALIAADAFDQEIFSRAFGPEVRIVRKGDARGLLTLED